MHGRRNLFARASIKERYFYLYFFKLSVDNVVIFSLFAEASAETSLLLRMLLLSDFHQFLETCASSCISLR